MSDFKSRNWIGLGAALGAAMIVSACDPADVTQDTPETAPVPSSEAPAPVAVAEPVIIGGSIDPATFAGRPSGRTLATLDYVREVTDDYVEIEMTSSNNAVGPGEPVAIEPGKTYKVTAVIERLTDDETVPTITAFSLDGEGQPMERNWSVAYFTAEDAPSGSVVELTQTFALNPEFGSGIRAFANPEDVRKARFLVNTNTGEAAGQIARIYSVKIEVGDIAG